MKTSIKLNVYLKYIIFIFSTIWLTSRIFAQSPYSKPGEPLDYQTLSHKLSIDLLRAGSHDTSGVNKYYFQVLLIGLLNSSEERNLPLEKRKKIEVELGLFGDTTLDALSIWRPDEKAKDIKEIAVDGNQIRALIARFMTEMKAQEPDIAVMVTINLFEKEKQFGFFGKDNLVATTSFYPLPPPLFESLFRTNTTLQMSDEKGLEVKIAVRFDSLNEASKNNTSPGSGTTKPTSTAVSAGKTPN